MEGTREGARAEESGAGRKERQWSEPIAHARNDAAGIPIVKPSVADLEAYVKAGLQLVPLHRWNARDGKNRPRGKSPKDLRWQYRKYDNGKVIELARKTGINVGVRLSPEWVVLDVDPRNFPEGRNSLEEFVQAFSLDLSNVPHTKTGSGGDHYWFTKPAEVPVIDTLRDRFEGIEFKSAGRQVVAAGSVHPNGQRYEVDDLAPEVSAAPPAPKALLDAIRRPAYVAASAEAPEPGELSPAKLGETLEHLKAENFREHDKWLNLMMACHHATAGEGREEFIEWSTQDPEYADHADVIGRRWDSLHAEGSRGGRPITINYLHKVMQEHGGHVAQTDPEDDFDLCGAPAENSASPARWRFLSVDELEALPPPVWLVSRILTEGSLAAIYGPPESFKSFLALDLSLSIAAGIHWHGSPVSPGGVMYIAGEGASGLGKRVRAWKRSKDVEKGQLKFQLMRDEINLASENDGEARAFVETVRRALGPLKLIVIDTLNQTAAGADENSAKDMSRYIASMKKLRDATGAAVLVVHHSGKDATKGMRGSNALLGAMDTTVEVERNGDYSVLVSVRKQKDAERAEPMRFSMEPCLDSRVLRWAEKRDPVADFVATADPVLELARELAVAAGGRVAQKELVEALTLRRGMSDKTARRKIDESISDARATARRSLDGTRVWRERPGKNPNGPIDVFAEKEQPT